MNRYEAEIYFFKPEINKSDVDSIPNMENYQSNTKQISVSASNKDEINIVITSPEFGCKKIEEDVITYLLKKNIAWVYQALVDDDWAFCLEEVELTNGVKTKELSIVHVDNGDEYTEYYCVSEVYRNMTIAEILSNSSADIACSISEDIAEDEVAVDEEDERVFVYKDGSRLKVKGEDVSVYQDIHL